MATTNFHSQSIMDALRDLARLHRVDLVSVTRSETEYVREFVVRDPCLASFKITETALEDSARPVELIDDEMHQARRTLNHYMIASMSEGDIESALMARMLAGIPVRVPSSYDEAAAYERLATQLMDLVKKSGIPL